MKTLCPYCRKIVAHRSKCKKWTQELEDSHKAQVNKQEEVNKQNIEEHAKLEEEMLRFSKDYPRLAEHIFSKLNDFESRLGECEPMSMSCNCRCCNNNSGGSF